MIVIGACIKGTFCSEEVAVLEHISTVCGTFLKMLQFVYLLSFSIK